MGRWIRRLLTLTLVGGAIFAIVRARGRAAEPTGTAIAPESTWPPLAQPGPEPEPDWVLPTDDHSCPIGYPIKANDSSHIFHVPGGRFYDRTHAERCYATAEAAERDGYRRAKA
ncbi:MAG: hypothetical protein JWM34_4493 [Ilumatobacteraceae bacterium]|nr:hypothetical protein [Ilumatobacteraceae bacterium]